MPKCPGSRAGRLGAGPVAPEPMFLARCTSARVAEVQAMTEQLRHGLVARSPEVTLAGEVEIDELYVVAGHKEPAAAVEGGGAAAAAGWRERRAAARRWRTGTDPRPDPARRSGSAAHAGQCAADDDRADHHGRRRQGRPRPRRRVRHLRPPAGLGLPAQDRLPQS
jgi:hypothetical protein